MPFKSKAQQRMMFAKHPKMAKRWAHETPDIKALPEKVREKKAEDLSSWFKKAKANGECICPSVRLSSCPVHGNKARIAKGLPATTPGEDKAKSKKASIPLLAQITVAMNAFELSKEGKEKTGMNSMTIGSFFDELEKISSALGTVYKTGITQAIPKLRGAAQGAAKAVSNSAGTVAGRAPKAMAGTAAGVMPKSLGTMGGTTARPPSGALTGTHLRSGAAGGTQINTQISPRSPGQGSTKITPPRAAPQTGATTVTRPAAPAAPAAAPPPTGRRRSLMGTLALGGSALGLGLMAGHAMPQQQQQPTY